MKKLPFENSEQNMKAIEEMFADGIRKQIEARDIAAILLYFQVVALDGCTLDEAIAKFAVDIKPSIEDLGREQWYTTEEFSLIPRQEKLMITTEQHKAFAEKAFSVIRRIATKLL